MSDKLTLSASEVAYMLGMSVKWVYLNKESIPGYFKKAGTVFFRKQSVMDWINNPPKKS